MPSNVRHLLFIRGDILCFKQCHGDGDDDKKINKITFDVTSASFCFISLKDAVRDILEWWKPQKPLKNATIQRTISMPSILCNISRRQKFEHFHFIRAFFHFRRLILMRAMKSRIVHSSRPIHIPIGCLSMHCTTEAKISFYLIIFDTFSIELLIIPVYKNHIMCRGQEKKKKKTNNNDGDINSSQTHQLGVNAKEKLRL